jgi:glutamyl-tRNA reductase
VVLAKQIFSDLSKATVVLIGAGENIELTLQHLLNKEVKQVYILNRTLANAQMLAAQYGVQALPLTELSSVLSQADVVISSIASQEPLLTTHHVEKALSQRKRRPIFMVDLGVPRNIEAQVGKNEDIYLYTVDDLQGIVTENLKNREEAAIQAEDLIETASEAFMHWLHSQQHVENILTIRQHVLDIKEDALTTAFRNLDNGQDPKAVLADFAHRLTQKLMHQPTVSLRKMNKETAKEKIEIVKELFSIE